MNKIKFELINKIAYLSLKTSRLLRLGGGTALPGLIIEKYNKDFTNDIGSKIDNIILITGTNGKTTVSKILETVLTDLNYKVIRNRSGANLLRGINSTLLENIKGITKGSIKYAIFEVEEATLPIITKQIQPKYIVLTNIFRDQLDAYGEIDKTAKLIKDGIENAPNAKVIYNSDDARINYISSSRENSLGYGFTENESNAKNGREISDGSNCPNCRAKLSFENIVYSHIGKFSCSNCGFRNGDIEYKISKIKANEDSIEFDVNDYSYKINLSGIYNVYNTGAAIALLTNLGIRQSDIKQSLQKFSPAFGRGEKIQINGVGSKIILVKNPTGMNNAFDLVNENNIKYLFLALNDNIADGRDVSWIWDCDFERLNDKKNKNIIVSGKRAYDMALRLKYADFNLDNICVEPDIKLALEKIDKNTSEEIYILPTYTAMLEIRRNLSNKDSSVDKFWK